MKYKWNTHDVDRTVIEIKQADDKELYKSLHRLAESMNVPIDSNAFSYRISKLIEAKTEQIENCKHEWQADSCGMMVSRYSCKHCGIEKMVSDPC